MRKIQRIAAIALSVSIINSSPAASPELSLNPYCNVQWPQAGHYKANLHTHTTASDGSWNPHQIVDKYHQAGYKVLAISDHDIYTSRPVWPWQEFDKVNPSAKAKSNLSAGKLDKFSGNLIYENRDPSALGMLAVQANEISRQLHVLSWFTDWQASSTNLDVQLAGIGSRGGLGAICHPAWMWTKKTPLPAEMPEETVQNHIALFIKYPALVAVEIINGTVPLAHRPYDRAMWDRILDALMPARPVWGLAVDDMHSSQFGIGWVVFLTPGLDETSVRQALVDGAFYFSGVSSVPADADASDSIPKIERITHDAEAGRITLTASVNGAPVSENACVWIEQGGKTIHTGLSLDYRTVPGIRNYVRAEIAGPKGTTFTNPFGFITP